MKDSQIGKYTFYIIMFFNIIIVSCLYADPSEQVSLDSLNSIKRMGTDQLKQRQYETAITLFKKGIDLNKPNPIDSLETYFLYHIGLCYYFTGKYGLSIDHYEQAISIIGSNNELIKRKRFSLWGQSLSYKRLGNFIEALKKIDLAISLTDNNDPFKASYYVIEGNLHRQLKQDSLSIEAHKNALGLYENLNDTLRMSMALNNIGIAYANLENYEEAFTYYLEALKLKKQTKNQDAIASTLNNIGDLHIIQGEYQKAEPYYKQSLAIRKKQKEKGELVRTLNSMGNLYLCLKKVDIANQYLQEAKSLLDISNIRFEKLENLYLFSKLHYLKGDNQKGDEYHLQYVNLNDSLYNELDVSQSILKAEREKLEAEKEQAILFADKQVLEEKNKFQQYQIWSSLIIIAALAALGYILYRQRNMRKRLAEELNHRTKNNYQLFLYMLGYQKQRFENPETQRLLNEIQNRMSAMAQTHKLLKPQKSLYSVNMQEYIEKILGAVCYSFGYSTDCLNLVVPPIELSMKRANYIGFIVNEVATNAIKYAFPQTDKPELTVTLLKEDSKISLFMQDNGKEIPPHDPNISTSLGMTLIEDFTYNLKGKSQFEHTGDGMLFQLEFSI